VRRSALDRVPTDELLSSRALVFAGCTLVALFALVRLRVGLNYSTRNLVLMLTIYLVAALPFFAGGLVVTMAISRLRSQANAVYAADLAGAAGGCLILLPILDWVGAPGAVLAAAAMATVAALLFSPTSRRKQVSALGAAVVFLPL